MNNTRGSSSNGYQSLTIGRPNNTTDYHGNFEIAEVIVISSTDSQKIKDIQYYLSSKWGLGLQVDSDGDGFVDSVEISNNSDPKDPSSKPQDIPSVVGEAKLWLDATNVDGKQNNTLSNGSSISCLLYTSPSPRD